MRKGTSALSGRMIAAAVVAAIAFAGTAPAQSQSLKDLFGGSKTGSTVGNIIEGIFTKSDLTAADIAGEWQTEGPAVCFQSENFLKKAGGLAAASALETELSPYYERYGLNNMKMTIDEQGNYTMDIKKLSLSGVMTPNKGEGTFNFELQALGFTLGSYTAYVSATSQTLNIMFDATKMKQFISAVAKFTGNNLAKTLGTILDSYDGACIGFEMKRIGGKAPTTSSWGTKKDSNASKTSTDKKGNTKVTDDSTETKSGLEGLRDLINKSKTKGKKK